MDIFSLIAHLPKTELHLHIEGTLEPELMWQLAKKHNIALPFKDVEAIKQAYQFDDLQSFLDLYYQGAEVLRDEDDFYLLMQAYLRKCKEDNVVHTEIMFDPQTHTDRGIAFSVFMAGFKRAISEAYEDCGISVYLILSFLRHLSEADAFQTLADAAPYYSDIKAVGLDSSELGNPPQKFKKVYAKARDLGFELVAHAGEEGPADYIWQALDDLKVTRIDHGVRSAEDPVLLDYLSTHQIPLTVCPLSNVKLCVVNDLADHNILSLLDDGLCVTVNSDDPSYFGGYVNANYAAIAHSLNMSESQLISLVKNSFMGSFLHADLKHDWIRKVEEIASNQFD